MAKEPAEKPYADYDWYINDFYGSLLSEEEFPRYAKWASYLIDDLTYGNITADIELPDCVRDATCAAAELAQTYYKSTIGSEEGRARTQETNDGYSVTFNSTLASAESLQEECIATISIYLRNSGLLYRGVRRVHHDKCYRNYYYPYSRV